MLIIATTGEIVNMDHFDSIVRGVDYGLTGICALKQAPYTYTEEENIESDCYMVLLPLDSDDEDAHDLALLDVVGRVIEADQAGRRVCDLRDLREKEGYAS